MTPDWILKIWDGTQTNAVPLMFMAFLAWRVGKIEKKLDSFISKETLQVLAESAKREHELMWAAIRGRTDEA